jgi:hypothetical protein
MVLFNLFAIGAGQNEGANWHKLCFNSVIAGQMTTGVGNREIIRAPA